VPRPWCYTQGRTCPSPPPTRGLCRSIYWEMFHKPGCGYSCWRCTPLPCHRWLRCWRLLGCCTCFSVCMSSLLPRSLCKIRQQKTKIVLPCSLCTAWQQRQGHSQTTTEKDTVAMLTLYSQPTTKQGYCCHVNCEQSDSKQLNKDNVATFTVCSQTTDKDTVAIFSVYSQITDKDNVAMCTIRQQTKIMLPRSLCTDNKRQENYWHVHMLQKCLWTKTCTVCHEQKLIWIWKRWMTTKEVLKERLNE